MWKSTSLNGWEYLVVLCDLGSSNGGTIEWHGDFFLEFIIIYIYIYIYVYVFFKIIFIYDLY